ncbi:MAG: 4-hydroxy-3-methylbut-2-enyl diphosphate reductase [Muribaculaceae bacterium]|nr:4-hydroxy-3-methylbut-2-enyl diphosphate reductase [Muribaculaceae bacterium]
MKDNRPRETGSVSRSPGSSPIIEIDSNSGFCFGVVTAIDKAEAELSRGEKLSCLGDIVHNASEVERLRLRGLQTITHEDLARLTDSTVLLRAHGEPPTTYEILRKNHNRVIDATCPVVLRLQQRIKQAYDKAREEVEEGVRKEMPLILIYGKEGHAEVNGLVGQTEGNAVVIQGPEALDALDLDRDILLYSQTTKSLAGFRSIVEAIRERKRGGTFEYFDTICRQVATRSEKIKGFASSHDTILFVSGAKSSNGKVLLEECRKVNPRTYAVTDIGDLRAEWLEGARKIGICGATSTPAWLMEEVAEKARAIYGQ